MLPPNGAAQVGAAKSKWTPRRWELFLAGEVCHPCVACWFFFLLGSFLAFAFIYRASVEGEELFTFKEAPVKSSLIVQSYHGFTAARGEKVGCDSKENEQEEACKADDTCHWNEVSRTCGDAELCPAPPPKPRAMPLMNPEGGKPGWVFVLYEVQDGASIFDDDVLGQILKFETELLTTANGAQLASGEASPWDRDWCKMTYSQDNSSAGRCSPPNSLLSLFTMTERGRSTVRTQVLEGFSPIPSSFAKCLCTDQDELCAVCTPDGGAKAVFTLPPQVLGCLIAAAFAPKNTPAPDAAATAGGNSSAVVCPSQGGEGLLAGSSMTELIATFCQTKPSCQWSPPWTGVCSSTGYYASDWADLLVGAEKEAVISKMCDESLPKWGYQRKMLLPQGFDCTAANKTSKYARTFFYPGRESGSNDQAFNQWKEDYVKGPNGWYAKAHQLKVQTEKESNGKLRIILYSAATIWSQLLDILKFDMFLAEFSMLLVWTYMWWTLESFFLACCAIFCIVFSLPAALCLWTIVLGQKIQFIQMLVIYMVLGIGVDNAFILYDAWVQASLAGDDVMENWATRFAYSYRKSFKTMLVTTLTTIGSFIIGAASPLPRVRDFCIFAAVVVLVQWLFCIAFFASAIVVYARYFKGSAKPGECMGPGCCWGGVRAMSTALCGKRCYNAEASGAPQKRAMERFCEGPLFGFLVKWKMPLIVVWVAIMISAAVNAGMHLRTAHKKDPIGREDLDATRGMEIMMAEFAFKGQSTVSFVYGLDAKAPVEEWIGNEDPAPRYGSMDHLVSPEGQVELLQLCRAADLGAEANTRCSQGRTCLISGRGSSGRCPRNELIWRDRGMYLPEDSLCENGRYCFMETFADYWAATKGNCTGKPEANCTASAAEGCNWGPAVAGGTAICYSTTEPTDFAGLPAAEFQARISSEDFADYLGKRKKMLMILSDPKQVMLEARHTGWKASASSPQELSFAWVTFNATMPAETTVDLANEWYNRWEVFSAAHGPEGGFQTTEMYLFMVIQNEMLKAAVMGILLSLIVAYAVLLLTTQNWQLPSLGLLNIVGISVIWLGIIPMLGWSFGESQCIFLIAVVGLSVDYSVHLMVSYSRSGGSSRQERVKDALGEMGISVLNSAITTLLACVILFGCGLFFFFQFGVFVFFTIGLSILMSITFLIPLFLLLGPEGNEGGLRCRCRRRKKQPAQSETPV